MKTKTLEEQLEFCPLLNVCSLEYGKDLACQDETSDYRECLIFQEAGI